MASDGKGIAKMASAISANSKMANMADSVSVSVNESVNVNESSIAISLPLNDNTEYDITDSLVDDYKELYQAVDIVQEIRKMKGWLMSNPSKRKTRRGVLRFVTNWLSREQDKGGASQKVNKPQSYADINSTIREQMVTPKLKAYTMEEIKKIRQDEQDEQQRLLNVN
jgi:hypothetical protein